MKTIMLIGAMKCGTSTLYDWIAQHPAVCPCADKEPEFFSDCYESSVQGRDYDDLWAVNPARHTCRIDGSTGYTKFPQAKGVPERIRAHGLDPWFIYIVRDPIERAVSHYNHNRREPAFDPATPLSNEHFVSVSNYYLQLSQYLKVFPDRSRYLILDYAELAAPAPLCRKVYNFLGLDPAFVPVFVSRNLTAKRYRFSGVTDRLPWLKPLTRHLPQRWKEGVREAGGSLTKAVTTVDPTEVERIRELLHDDMIRLAREFAVDTRRWGFNAPTGVQPRSGTRVMAAER